MLRNCPESKRCGREDSNLHGYYPTRSLADTEPSQSLNLLEKEGSADAGKRRQTTLSGHGVPADHSQIVGVGELRKAARTLVLRVAAGSELPIEALRDFAALTLRCELVHLAQRLQEAPPEFAVRRAMELASLVLTLGGEAWRGRRIRPKRMSLPTRVGHCRRRQRGRARQNEVGPRTEAEVPHDLVPHR